jgi:hypothetical protein
MSVSKRALIVVRIASYASWLGVAVSFAIYNFYVQYNGLHRPPCTVGQAKLIFRSSAFCGSIQDVRFWNINVTAGEVLLAFAVVLTVIGGALRRR